MRILPSSAQEPVPEANPEPDVAALVGRGDLAAVGTLGRGRELVNKPEQKGDYPLHAAAPGESRTCTPCSWTRAPRSAPGTPAAKTPCVDPWQPAPPRAAELLASSRGCQASSPPDTCTSGSSPWTTP
ncbi:MAG: hypothetical protein MZV63_57580 [Marinilabiliales bacterium]|nr:hypothetical protein [Marinilabiliales bacterium]